MQELIGYYREVVALCMQVVTIYTTGSNTVKIISLHSMNSVNAVW